MGNLVVVKDDIVKGTDTHAVSGMTLVKPPVAYGGTGPYKYDGKMTDSLSTFVKIGGMAVAIVTSKSSLNPGETAPPGKHSGPKGSSFVAGPGSVAAAPTPETVSITDVIGTGVPNAAAGSALLTIDGTKVLLDGDKIDTCDVPGGTGNSTVTASGQTFMTCSA